jgi:hypothetical protein
MISGLNSTFKWTLRVMALLAFAALASGEENDDLKALFSHAREVIGRNNLYYEKGCDSYLRRLNNPIEFDGIKFDGHVRDEELYELINRLNARMRAAGIRNRPKEGAVIDWLVIGAGMHGAIANASLTALPWEATSVTLERGDVVSKTWGRLLDSFFINSQEFADKSANSFPNCNIQMKDITALRFPKSLHMAALVTICMYLADRPILFNTPAHFEDTWITGEAAPARYKVLLPEGGYFYARDYILTPGMGEPNFYVFEDKETRELLQTLASSKNERLTGDVNSLDDVLALLTKAMDPRESELRRKLWEESRGKTYVIVGKGDGGKIGVEALLGLGPLGQILHPTAKIIWIGQPDSSGQAYMSHTWERYHAIAGELGHRVLAVQGEAVRVKFNGTSFDVICNNGNVFKGDGVVLAIGYTNVVPSILASVAGQGKLLLPGALDFERVRNTLRPDQFSYIGQQVIINHNGRLYRQGYVEGPATGGLATESELKHSLTHNPMSLELLGPPSALLPLQIGPLRGPSKPTSEPAH